MTAREISVHMEREVAWPGTKKSNENATVLSGKEQVKAKDMKVAEDVYWCFVFRLEENGDLESFLSYISFLSRYLP